ncbi:MAG: hypothetical protein IH989_00615 [Planctomycetes bacterium]|nr:hypothetical protein [Planctomycetota bacterium]
MRHSRIQAVDHVNVESPHGLDDELRWFYGEVAELEERPPEATMGPGICFRSERIELRIRFSPEPRIESVECRVIVGVPSIDEAAERLSERKTPFQRLSGLAWSDRRIQVLDPAGNRVELRQAQRDIPL